ncbi:DUF4870 domain-containing protein [Paenactinomyces guangxiensis]|uniref:DUF4870 domain-containing protein n=1 Tax=Paenactinomyces guangxiensis TaxID=1490290 RepID=A0A7W2A8G3_9BACL|nr:DUF4870 domain-containing protein [Paenactinomyces guangxiensis]MBA4494149.1 DUF4870 domain-containing protein [Paenactinomyces guangxiensis]MBH8591106.1 DUF4870 domain-containing protein [Paenactinomyces guangxiensis]
MEYKWVKVLIHASTWFAPVLVPIIVYLVIRDREVKSLSLQALVFHLIIGILISISAFFSWILIGIPFLIIFALIAIIAPVKGMIRALQGRPFRYPMIGNWFS